MKTSIKLTDMALINPYIHFNGNAEEAFTFYKSVFGGEFTKMLRYKDLSSPDYPIPENDANRLMHIALPIGKSNSLIGSDVMEMMGWVTENDNRNTISISASNVIFWYKNGALAARSGSDCHCACSELNSSMLPMQKLAGTSDQEWSKGTNRHEP